MGFRLRLLVWFTRFPISLVGRPALIGVVRRSLCQVFLFTFTLRLGVLAARSFLSINSRLDLIKFTKEIVAY